MEITVNSIEGLQNIEDEILKELRNRSQKAASWAADELTDATKNAIDSFYGNYSPTIYKRKGGLKNSFSRFYENAHNTTYYGGVELSDSSSSYSSVVTGRSVDNAFVTMLAWFAGRHGFTEALPSKYHIKNYPPAMSPSPNELLIKKRKEVESKLENFFK